MPVSRKSPATKGRERLEEMREIVGTPSAETKPEYATSALIEIPEAQNMLRSHGFERLARRLRKDDMAVLLPDYMERYKVQITYYSPVWAAIRVPRSLWGRLLLLWGDLDVVYRNAAVPLRVDGAELYATVDDQEVHILADDYLDGWHIVPVMYAGQEDEQTTGHSSAGAWLEYRLVRGRKQPGLCSFYSIKDAAFCRGTAALADGVCSGHRFYKRIAGINKAMEPEYKVVVAATIEPRDQSTPQTIFNHRQEMSRYTKAMAEGETLESFFKDFLTDTEWQTIQDEVGLARAMIAEMIRHYQEHPETMGIKALSTILKGNKELTSNLIRLEQIRLSGKNSITVQTFLKVLKQIALVLDRHITNPEVLRQCKADIASKLKMYSKETGDSLGLR